MIPYPTSLTCLIPITSFSKIPGRLPVHPYKRCGRFTTGYVSCLAEFLSAYTGALRRSYAIEDYDRSSMRVRTHVCASGYVPPRQTTIRRCTRLLPACQDYRRLDGAGAVPGHGLFSDQLAEQPELCRGSAHPRLRKTSSPRLEPESSR
jgi:hypothetical protein